MSLTLQLVTFGRLLVAQNPPPARKASVDLQLTPAARWLRSASWCEMRYSARGTKRKGTRKVLRHPNDAQDSEELQLCAYAVRSSRET